jgi:hypothetical protein
MAVDMENKKLELKIPELGPDEYINYKFDGGSIIADYVNGKFKAAYR